MKDHGVAALTRGCQGLLKLNLNNCRKVSDLALLAISEAGLFPGLDVLLLANCNLISDTGVAWLSERCPTLLRLNLLGCSVSKSGLQAMVQAWKCVS